jgi:NADH:ubiquinone oxidoreductase subunit 3 (subunit A)
MFGWFGVLVGIIFILIGGVLVFFFPMAIDYQSEKFGFVGIVLGFIFLVIGGALIFIG